MKITRKLLSLSALFLILTTYFQPTCLAKAKKSKAKQSKQARQDRASSLKVNNLTVEGKGNFQKSVSIDGKTTLNNDLQINNGKLILATSKKAGNSTYVIDPASNQVQLNSFYAGQKSIKSNKTSTQIFSIGFNEFLEESSTPYYGAYLNLKVIVGGTISEDPTEIIYEGSLYVLPATSGGSPSTLTVLSEGSTQVNGGTSCSVSSSISGNGKTANISLNSSPNITDQTITFYYEVVSENIDSIN